MTDQLPNRPFTTLPPPPAGATTAVREGRGIRRRRRAAGAGAAALSVAVLAAVVAASGTGSVHANDQLVPAGPRPGVDTGRPARSAAALDSAARATSVPAPAASGVAKAQAARAQAARAQAARSPRPATSPYGGTEGQPTASSYQTPALRRTYSPPIPAGARVCSAQVSDSPGGTHKRIDWCMTAAVTTTEAGHDLTVEVCRDQTTDSALSFDTTREADLVITRAGHEVWRWSVGHIAKPRTHALQTPAGACWSWTAPWTDVNGAGRPTPSGSYELVGTSLAGELADLPDVSTTFTIA